MFWISHFKQKSLPFSVLCEGTNVGNLNPQVLWYEWINFNEAFMDFLITNAIVYLLF